MTGENLEDRIEEIVEKKVQERMQEEREKIREEVREDLENEERRLRPGSKLSRRSFLKKVGAGVVGLGALSLTTSSALDIKSDGMSFYGGQGSSLDLDLDNSGNMTLYGDVASSAGNTIWDSTNQYIPADQIEQGEGSGLDADTLDGDDASDIGGGISSMFDLTTIASNGGGGIYPNTSVSRSVTKQAITSGTQRIGWSFNGGGAVGNEKTCYIDGNTVPCTTTTHEINSSVKYRVHWTDSVGVFRTYNWSIKIKALQA